MTNREVPRPDPFENDGIDKDIQTPDDVSALRRVGRAAIEVVADITKIVMNGNAGEAVKESASRLN